MGNVATTHLGSEDALIERTERPSLNKHRMHQLDVANAPSRIHGNGDAILCDAFVIEDHNFEWNLHVQVNCFESMWRNSIPQSRACHYSLVRLEQHGGIVRVRCVRYR